MNLADKIIWEHEPFRIGMPVYVTDYGHTYIGFPSHKVTGDKIKNDRFRALKNDWNPEEACRGLYKADPNLKVPGTIIDYNFDSSGRNYVYLVDIGEGEHIAINKRGLEPREK